MASLLSWIIARGPHTVGLCWLVLTGFAVAAEPLRLSSPGHDLIPGPRKSQVAIWSAAYSPDGKFLAVGDGLWNVRGEVALWDTQARKRLWLKTEVLGIRRVVFSPDGEWIATASYSGRVTVRDRRTGKTRYFDQHHNGHAYAVAFSTDGRLLASGGADRKIYIRQAATGKLLRTLEGNASGVYYLRFGAPRAANRQAPAKKPAAKKPAAARKDVESNGRKNGEQVATTLYSAGGDSRVKVWDVESEKVRLELIGHEGPIEAVELSPDGKLLATASWDKTVRLWSPVDGKPRGTLRGHKSQVLSLAFSQDGKRLISGGGVWASQQKSPPEARVWDVKTGKFIRWLEGHAESDKIFAVGLSPDGREAFTGGWGNLARVWNVETGELLKPLVPGPPEFEPSGVLDVALVPGHQQVAVAGEDGAILIREIEQGEVQQAFQGFSDVAACVAVSPDGKWLAAGSYDRSIRVWERATGKLRHRFTGHRNWVLCLAFTPDGKRLVSGSFDNTVKIWDLAAGKLARTFAAHSSSVRALVVVGDDCISAGGDKTIRRWNLDTLQETAVLQGHEGAIRALAVSNDGKQLASGGEDRLIHVWDLERGQRRHSLRSHRDAVVSLAFSRNGRVLASGSRDRTIMIWDASTGTRTQELAGHSGLVSGLVFAPKDEFLVSGSYDQQVKRWNRVIKDDADKAP